MKNILLLTSMVFFLFACNKSNIDKPDILYPVQVQVALDVSPFKDMGSPGTITSSTADTALNKLGVLYFSVFDETGKFLHQVEQLRASPNFGVFSDQLKVGKYTIVVTASTGEILISNAPLTLSVTKFKAISASGDIFFIKSDITVTSEGLIQKLFLKRPVSYLELKSTSAIASTVSKISFSVINEAPYFWCATEVVDLNIIEKSTVIKDVTTANRSNFSIGKYIMNDQQLLSIQISTLDAAGGVIKSKTIGSIKMERNKMRSISANLTDLMAVGIGLDLNDEWQVDTISIPFQLY
ncbi:hypothetical protein ADIARSV_1253 [Arcticibacter svalbardensis MN12-7]|uniref:Lipoprotein n=1 Tax=Arcticibacter svalbardensis MN12-7 TaxID=1150600 RepID=R9GVM1_9SPHI|nr:FimB/Mfa2 family fimbrial subunit [Arcticibacter svalbardensis]EOR95570.1 hypothetical protein ADIARSV_1253 [Arcticibacter svalbardensis MN12-7]